MDIVPLGCNATLRQRGSIQQHDPVGSQAKPGTDAHDPGLCKAIEGGLAPLTSCGAEPGEPALRCGTRPGAYLRIRGGLGGGESQLSSSEF